MILKGAFTVDRKMKEYVHFPAKSSASGVTDTVSISLYAMPFFCLAPLMCNVIGTCI